MITPTNQPAFYFPPDKGVYETKPGLSTISTDFGNGRVDTQTFQIDNQFNTYRQNKLKARNESFKKYVCLQPGRDLSGVNQYIIESLCHEHPDYFTFNNKAGLLDCHLTGEQCVVNNEQSSQYFDALAMQIQEDLAIMAVDSNGEGKIIALHLCAPNHWAAQDKIGKDFISLHSPVPNMERINQRNREINLACLNKGPFVRFAWGLSTDNYLNHHPQPRTGITHQEWQGRQFKLEQPMLYMRVERQTLTGIKNEAMILFTIRTYFYDVQLLTQQQLIALVNAIHSMDNKVLRYKGLQQKKDEIVSWLENLL